MVRVGDCGCRKKGVVIVFLSLFFFKFLEKIIFLLIIIIMKRRRRRRRRRRRAEKEEKVCNDLGKVKFEFSSGPFMNFGNSKIQIIKSQKPIHKISNTPSYHFHNSV